MSSSSLIEISDFAFGFGFQFAKLNLGLDFIKRFDLFDWIWKKKKNLRFIYYIVWKRLFEAFWLRGLEYGRDERGGRGGENQQPYVILISCAGCRYETMWLFMSSFASLHRGSCYPMRCSNIRVALGQGSFLVYALSYYFLQILDLIFIRKAHSYFARNMRY